MVEDSFLKRLRARNLNITLTATASCISCLISVCLLSHLMRLEYLFVSTQTEHKSCISFGYSRVSLLALHLRSTFISMANGTFSKRLGLEDVDEAGRALD